VTQTTKYLNNNYQRRYSGKDGPVWALSPRLNLLHFFVWICRKPTDEQSDRVETMQLTGATW